ncbi:Uncharacterized protein FWK35_00016453 [Aphis craccivora]|uniref:Uncharacterized protein n=1 Tax=Aphis craccivora TaxID=307492 RepID=A0A6G0YC50_APHCR|nr:Uncharacterized protein FWK35_00016453 [Aphis craccivora]
MTEKREFLRKTSFRPNRFFFYGCNSKTNHCKYLKFSPTVYVKVNLDGCLFGKVKKILIGKSMIPYFIVKPLYSIGFDSHFYAHEVEDNTNTYDQIGYYIN